MVKLSNRIKKTPAQSAPWYLACMLIFWASCSNAGAFSPQDFIGPLPGVQYFYKDSHNAFEVRGLAFDETGALLVEQTFHYPEQPGQSELCLNEFSEIYGYAAEGMQLLRKTFPLHDVSGYETMLNLEKPEWGKPVTLCLDEVDGTTECRKAMSKCAITRHGKQTLFGMERTVVTVDGEYCPPMTFASGIGCIEMHGVKLVKIEYLGREMKVFDSAEIRADGLSR